MSPQTGLGADLHQDGFLNITNVDQSAVVISQMADRYADREEMEFTAMDVRRMEFLPNNCFDIVIDKALLDSQICTVDNLRNVSMQVQEIHR